MDSVGGISNYFTQISSHINNGQDDLTQAESDCINALKQLEGDLIEFSNPPTPAQLKALCYDIQRLQHTFANLESSGLDQDQTLLKTIQETLDIPLSGPYNLLTATDAYFSSDPHDTGPMKGAIQELVKRGLWSGLPGFIQDIIDNPFA